MEQGEVKIFNGTLYYYDNGAWTPYQVNVFGGGGGSGARGPQGPIGPQGPSGGIVPATTDASLKGDGTVGDPLGLPYKLYVALLTQSSTNAPVVVSNGTGPNTPLENTIGNIVWTRTAMGSYQGTLAGAFTNADKVFNLVGIDETADGAIMDFSVINANTIQIDTFLFDGVGYNNSDDILNRFPIEIRVYP